MLSIPSNKVATREEFVVDMAILTPKQTLVIEGDGKPFKMKAKDWQLFVGERARRGNKLPRGCRSVRKLSVESE